RARPARTPAVSAPRAASRRTVFWRFDSTARDTKNAPPSTVTATSRASGSFTGEIVSRIPPKVNKSLGLLPFCFSSVPASRTLSPSTAARGEPGPLRRGHQLLRVGDQLPAGGNLVPARGVLGAGVDLVARRPVVRWAASRLHAPDLRPPDAALALEIVDAQDH